MKQVLVSTAGSEDAVAVVTGRGAADVQVGPRDDSRLVGNIYRGTAVTVDANLQAAFIDFGMDWDGFLHVSNVHAAYGPHNDRGHGIQDSLREGSEVVVQLMRDKRRLNDFALTTNLSIPGRYLVLMPGSNHVAVSKKIVDRNERDRLKGILADLAPPENLGYVIRTEGVNSSPEQLGADLTFLLRSWRRLSERIARSQAPSLVYREYEWPIRQVREVLDRDVEELVCDDPDLHVRLQAFVKILQPDFRGRVTLHDSARPLLASHGVTAR